MEYIYKIVDFHTYCDTCKYKNVKDSKEPCNECLSSPAREHSRKPLKYVKQEKKTKKG